VPFLMLPLALVIESARKSWLRAACASLCAGSVVITSALTFVNYIPDDVSNAVLGLAVPLTRSGALVPSLLCVVGIPNPLAGAVLWLGVLAVASWVVWSLRPAGSARAWVAALTVPLVLVAFNVATYRDSPSDRGALALLQRVWLAPAGHVFSLTGAAY
jgi:hypothetical protein